MKYRQRGRYGRYWYRGCQKKEQFPVKSDIIPCNESWHFDIMVWVCLGVRQPASFHAIHTRIISYVRSFRIPAILPGYSAPASDRSIALLDHTCRGALGAFFHADDPPDAETCGCGDGRIVLVAAMRYHARAVGIEIDPLRYLWCQFLITIMFQRKRVRIVFGNLFKQDLSEADVVMCYLMPDALQKLERKFRQELRPGTRIVSNKYVFPTLNHVREDGNVRLYLVQPDNGELK